MTRTAHPQAQHRSPRRPRPPHLLGALAVLVTVLAVALGLTPDVSPLAARSAGHRATSRSADQRQPTVSRSSEHPAAHPTAHSTEPAAAEAPATPVAARVARPAAGTQLMVDTASAPSWHTVRRWQRTSPYRSIGVYVHVARAADDRHDKTQRHLTAGWVRKVRAGGWRVLPIYLGRQAPQRCQSGRFHAMSADPVTAQRQGVAAAEDASRSVDRLGLTAVPLMYDMEGYAPGCAGAVRAYLLGWTARLHQLGRLAGVYGSPTSVGRDLLAAGPGYARPDVLWSATANGSASTAVRQLPRRAWRGRRANQFALDVHRRYGGRRLAVDDSAVDERIWAIRPATGRDTRAPVLTVGAGPAVSARRRASWRWQGLDEVSARLAYQVQVRRTPAWAPVGDWSAPAAVTRRLRVPTRPGEQVCLRVRARDAAGNASGWERRCRSRLADDRQLRRLDRHQHGWRQGRLHGAFRGTVTTATHRHAVLRLGRVASGAVGVVVRGRGAVVARVGRHRVGVLHAGGMRWARVGRPGDLTLTATSGRVAIDAIAAAPR